jgi:hypothetical protein
MNITIFKKHNSNGTDIQNELHSFAISTGKNLGLLDLPKNHSEYSAMFLNVLKSKIRAYIKGVELAKKPHSQKAIAHAAQKTKDDKVRVLRADLIDDETQMQLLDREIQNMPFTRWDIIKYYLIKLVIVLLSFAESFMVYSAFRNNGIPTIGAIIASLSIGLGIFVITDYIAHWLLASKKIWIAWLRGLFASCAIFLFLYGISLIRVTGMSNEAALNKGFSDVTVVTQTASAPTLALISTGMFIIGLLITMWYGLSKDDKWLLRQYFKKWWQLRKVKRKANKTLKKIADTEDEAFEVSKNAITIYDEAYTSQSLLNHYGNEAVALFISANMTHRTDGYCPPFYANPNEFKSHFSHQQNNDKI